MKRRFSMLMAAGVLITAFNASTIITQAAPVEGINCLVFVDANGDGICDYCGVQAGFVDLNGRHVFVLLFVCK